MGLCDSRMLYVACTVSQTMEHCLACPQHACEFFGGIPHNGMVDNLTAAVLTRARGEAPVFKPKSLDFARHNGFTIAPCHVGKGNEKGRGEHGVGDVKKHCLAGLELPACSALNPAARQWLETVAHGRLHSDTRDQPGPAWHQERPYLRPLPLHPFDIAPVSQVRASRPWRLTLETNRDAVPAHYAGQALTRNTSPERRCISHGDQLIARHTRRDERFQALAAPAHPQPLREQRKKARDHQLFRRLLALSPRAAASDLQLAERRLHPPHHVRNIVAWSDMYDPQTVARAIEDALTYAAFSAEYIANLLAQRARFTPEASTFPLTRRADLLEVSLAPPDLSLSHATPYPEPPDA
jgi:Mu transposase, C-terminal domain